MVQLLHVGQERRPDQAADTREKDAIAVGHKTKVYRRNDRPEANAHLRAICVKWNVGMSISSSAWPPTGAHLVRGQELVGHLTTCLLAVQRFHVRHAKEEAARRRRTVRQLLDGGLGHGRAQRDGRPYASGEAHPCEKRGRHEQRAVDTEAGAFRPVVGVCMGGCVRWELGECGMDAIEMRYVS